MPERPRGRGSNEITRCGKVVARLTPATTPRVAVDPAALAAVTATMLPPSVDAADPVRAMRDSDRY